MVQRLIVGIVHEIALYSRIRMNAPEQQRLGARPAIVQRRLQFRNTSISVRHYNQAMDWLAARARPALFETLTHCSYDQEPATLTH